MPKFPFTNYHELNLDWILKEVKALFTASEENAKTIRTYDNRLTNAELTATNAGNTATAAQQLADAAAANADNALSVAGTADSKADSALTAATNASGAASGALTVAQEARQIAGNAQSAAADAGALANDASNAAAAAQQTADTNAGNIATLQTTVETISGKVSDIDNKADVIIDSASGSIASFADGADDMPIRSLIVNIDPAQSGSGDPSPENIRPITGRTGTTVRHDKYIIGFEQGGLRDVDGSPAAVNTRIRTGAIPIDAFPNESNEILLLYTGNQNIVLRSYYWYTSTDTFIRATGSTGKLVPITRANIPTNAAYLRVVLQLSDETLEISPVGVYIDINPSEPLEISWQSVAGAVYGGTLDVISGVLTVDRAIISLAGSASWSELNGYYRMVSVLTNYNNIYTKLKSNMFLFADNFSDTSAYVTIAGTIYAPKNITTAYTLEEWKAFLNSNPLIVVYPITQPQTYQLTPKQINTLLGQNNIYSDVGSIADVRYPADTKLYIDGKIAELQALVLEN